MVKSLIINADDYGLCAEVNAAIEELIEAGRLRDVSVLAGGDVWEHAVRFLAQRPHISVGAHLNAVEGRPVSSASEVRLLIGANGRFIGLPGLLARWVRQPFAVTRALEIEWRAQLERLRQAGLHISHADSHQHLHAFPLAWRCAVKLCREYGISALRLPRERNQLPQRRVGAFALGASLALSTLTTAKHEVFHNNHFLGFKRAGDYDLDALTADLRALPHGVTELALHPSTRDGIPYPHLHGDRERRALLNESLPARLAELGITLTSWKELAG